MDRSVSHGVDLHSQSWLFPTYLKGGFWVSESMPWCPVWTRFEPSGFMGISVFRSGAVHGAVLVSTLVSRNLQGILFSLQLWTLILSRNLFSFFLLVTDTGHSGLRRLAGMFAHERSDHFEVRAMWWESSHLGLIPLLPFIPVWLRKNLSPCPHHHLRSLCW